MQRLGSILPFDQRSGRADGLAGAARSAVIGLGRVGRKIEGGKDLPEEEPRAEVARDQIGVAALPTQAGPGRQGLLHDRRGIGEHLDGAAMGVTSQRARSFSRFFSTSW